MSSDPRPYYEEIAALVARQAERIAQLEAEVADLQRRLGQNSRNSDRPPSSEGWPSRRRSRWTGEVDDVRVYKAALDEATILRVARGSRDAADIPQ